MISGLNEFEEVAHRCPWSQFTLFDIPRIHACPTGCQHTTLVDELTEDTTWIEFLVSEIGSLNAITKEERLDVVAYLERFVRESERIEDGLRVVCGDDEVQLHG